MGERNATGGGQPATRSRADQALHDQARALGFQEALELLSPARARRALAIDRQTRTGRDRAAVEQVQSFLGVPPEGEFDLPTVYAAAGFQQSAKLAIDGIVGPNTLRAFRRQGAFDEATADRSEEQEPRPTTERSAPEPGPPAAEGVSASEGAAQAIAQESSGSHAAREPTPGASPRSGPSELAGGRTHGRFATTLEAGPGAKARARALSKNERRAYAEYRRLAPRTAWMVAVQRLLGVPDSGRLDSPTIRALGDRYPSSRGILDRRMAEVLDSSHPELGGHRRDEDVGGAMTEEHKVYYGRERKTVEGELKMSWKEWLAQFSTSSFCGLPVSAHPILSSRLANAETYLLGRFSETDPKQLGRRLGLHGTETLRPPGQGMHTLGLAIDFNKPENPWIIAEHGKADRNAETKAVMDRAVALMGTGEELTGPSMGGMGRRNTTEDAFDRLQETNVTLRRYRALASDREGLRAHLRGQHPELDGAALERLVAEQQAIIAKDDATLSDTRKANWNRESDNTGFMDLQKELVIALRDVGGLGWGAIDLGGESGDIQHFDARHDPVGRQLHSALLRGKYG